MYVRTAGHTCESGTILFSALNHARKMRRDCCYFKGMDCLDFFCPVCGSNLQATGVNPNLARVIMIDEDQKEYDVYFSRLRGEQSTFKISNGDIVDKYGKDSSSYMDYFMSKLTKGRDKKED
jgi:hypothetical protein